MPEGFAPVQDANWRNNALLGPLPHPADGPHRAIATIGDLLSGVAHQDLFHDRPIDRLGRAEELFDHLGEHRRLLGRGAAVGDQALEVSLVGPAPLAGDVAAGCPRLLAPMAAFPQGDHRQERPELVPVRHIERVLTASQEEALAGGEDRVLDVDPIADPAVELPCGQAHQPACVPAEHQRLRRVIPGPHPGHQLLERRHRQPSATSPIPDASRGDSGPPATGLHSRRSDALNSSM